MDKQEAKRQLHEDIQKFGANNDDLDGALLTRAVVITEWILPASGLALYRVTTGPDGTELRSWEVAGILASSLANILAQDRSEPA